MKKTTRVVEGKRYTVTFDFDALTITTHRRFDSMYPNSTGRDLPVFHSKDKAEMWLLLKKFRKDPE